jgi:DNA polymerase-3 subunit alpha
VDDITKHTNYQVVYQEQILQVVRLLGEFSWEEAARIRKIISKKRGEQEFNRQRDKFVEGAATHGMDERDAHRVFNMLATAGAYAFNAAHCVSYGLLAYWCMWIKQNDPAAFYAGSLRKTGDNKEGKKKRDQLLRDLTKKGVPILPLCINNSELNWTKDGDALRPGFLQVTGVGDKTAQAIVDERERRGQYDTWDDVMDVKGVGPVMLEKLYDFANDDKGADTFGLRVLSDKLDRARAALASGVWDGVLRLPEPTHTSAEVPYERTAINVGVQWLGVFRERNLKDLFEMHHSKTGEVLDPNSVKSPERNEWLVFLGEDDTDILSVTIDRWRYPKLKERAWSIRLNEDLVLIRGIKRKEQSRRAVYVTDLWVITEEMLGATTEG